MGILDKAWSPGRIVEMGTYGLVRYAKMSNGETIWWGMEETVPQQVALAAWATEAEAKQSRAAAARERVAG
ncbi:hypothetical protein M446_0998 [Methylobacterium sp. 4-46]|uniref:hypothetical protein n=1 Tax=unclassified Methylobacterium TaxID=2615210 RepID=UPI000165C5DC|nr:MULTISPECIES: hypothetical protein [Methylobacterium]ACA15532.1 hypothetical protein M446_0998 [Methylobacterium sp. 4-46]WFT81250.1 hypothetical protein QA634_04950 [Methylobacterium nodulans]